MEMIDWSRRDDGSRGHVYRVKNTAIFFDNFVGIPKGGAVFLSHCHADHYRGLSNNWARGPIYCSKESMCILLERFPDLNAEFRVVESGKWYNNLELDGMNFNLYVADAHHCPGSIMFKIQGPFGVVVYTGDFRIESSFLDVFKESHGELFKDVVDCLLIDQTLGTRMHKHLETKNVNGIAPERIDVVKNLIEIVKLYPKNTVFHLGAEFGKEWCAAVLAEVLDCNIAIQKSRIEEFDAISFSNSSFLPSMNCIVGNEKTNQNYSLFPSWPGEGPNKVKKRKRINDRMVPREEDYSNKNVRIIVELRTKINLKQIRSWNRSNKNEKDGPLHVGILLSETAFMGRKYNGLKHSEEERPLQVMSRKDVRSLSRAIKFQPPVHLLFPLTLHSPFQELLGFVQAMKHREVVGFVPGKLLSSKLRSYQRGSAKGRREDENDEESDNEEVDEDDEDSGTKLENCKDRWKSRDTPETFADGYSGLKRKVRLELNPFDAIESEKQQQTSEESQNHESETKNENENENEKEDVDLNLPDVQIDPSYKFKKNLNYDRSGWNKALEWIAMSIGKRYKNRTIDPTYTSFLKLASTFGKNEDDCLQHFFLTLGPIIKSKYLKKKKKRKIEAARLEENLQKW